MSALRFQGNSKSVPSTPQGTVKRSATFSPRIQFHDTWPSGEYDRRGEIATCNRLTPMLAQQIKEELNTFKMVRLLTGLASDKFANSNRKWRYTRTRRSTHTFSDETTTMAVIHGPRHRTPSSHNADNSHAIIQTSKAFIRVALHGV